MKMPSASPLINEDVFGLPFLASNLSDSTHYFCLLVDQLARPYCIAHADVHVLTRALHDPLGYGALLAHFDVLCPDGIPILYLLRGKHPHAERLYGPDMMLKMMDVGRGYGLRHFLLGGSEQAQQLLLHRLPQRFAGLEIAGAYSPPMGQWPEGEHEAIAQRIKSSGAQCVWVGLGCPKQERWLAEHLDVLPPALYFAVGAAFDFHAGLVAQAPLCLRQHGLEWLYRLLQEPRRLMKRYLIHNSLFLWYCLTRKH